MTIIPIPNTQKNLLAEGKSGNFSLYFPRMVTWLDMDGEKMKDKECIVNLGKESVSRFDAAKSVLASIHEKQRHILEKSNKLGSLVFEFHAKLSSPYISGLGAGHPTETGMIFDRNTGMPYLPASGIKGALRLAHSLNIMDKEKQRMETAENNKSEWLKRGNIDKKGYFIENDDGDQFCIDDNEPTLRMYFGDTDTKRKDCARGQLVFLDAFPETVPVIKTDIMNPHFGKYYNGEQPPVETESPIPIKFLTVKEGTEFIFRCFVSKLATPDKQDGVQRDWNDEDKLAVEAMFERALVKLGLGGKTAAGYGRFTELRKIDLTGEWKRAEEKAKEDAARKQKEDEEKKLQAEREQVVARLKAEKEAAEQQMIDAKKQRITELSEEIEKLGTGSNEKEQKKIDRLRKLLELVKFALENNLAEVKNRFQSVYDSTLATVDTSSLQQIHFEAADTIFTYLQQQNLWVNWPKGMQTKIKDIKRIWSSNKAQ
ncbi:MAG TPA: type III-B CRISPR module RAMP protein Cmr6 [Chitinispirillaceae bacterium]|nr:type III-B CRISPR module RAMP protein Cmr6 [Chitinispirillaceae bacterium]